MCGRYTLHQSTDEVTRHFVNRLDFELEPRYNIAPTQEILILRKSDVSVDACSFDFVRWGLVPAWSKDASAAARMINARSETVATKPAFRSAYKSRRCLIPADGFYEWDKVTGSRQPYHFRRMDGRMFAFAGLWEAWTAPGGELLRTCTILTTSANGVVGPIHERMPVILQDQDAEHGWLRASKPDELERLLQPYPDAWMEAVPVSRKVNSPATNGPELILRNGPATTYDT
jgi:putative SOS response-associated peptidase YedK